MEPSKAEGKRSLKYTMVEEEEEDDEDVGEPGLGEDEKKRREMTNSNRRASGSGSGSTPIACQADNCNADLSEAKHYYRRHKVCEVHSKAPAVQVAGLQKRFCQQCSRLETLVLQSLPIQAFFFVLVLEFLLCCLQWLSVIVVSQERSEEEAYNLI